MEQKHIIKVFTAKELVTENDNHYQVKIFWQVDFCEEIVPYLSSKKVKHDPEDLKRGVGELTIEVSNKKFNQIDHLIAYAEACAFVYLVHSSGLNVFGTSCRHGVQKLQLFLQPTSALCCNLLSREPSFVKADSEPLIARMLRVSDFAAAYFYGAETGVTNDSQWVRPYLSGKKQPEYRNSVRAVSVKHLTQVNTLLGKAQITYRTVDDFVKMPLNRELAEKKNQIFTRPFESTYKVVEATNSVIPQDNKHLIKLKQKLGDNVASLLSENPLTLVDFKLEKRGEKSPPLVVGFRPLYSQEVMERLIDGGYAYHV